MIIESYQEAARLEAQPVTRHTTATVGQVFSDGVTLRFPGDSGPGKKHYKKLAAFLPKAGDRVMVQWSNGSYIVTGIIG